MDNFSMRESWVCLTGLLVISPVETSIWNRNHFSKYFCNICEFVLACIHYLFSVNESSDYFPW